MTGETARAEDEAAGQPETAGAAAGDPKPSTSLDRELAEVKDRLLRTLAEMENLRKRTEREVTDARLYGVASFARDVLGVADNIPPRARCRAAGGAGVCQRRHEGAGRRRRIDRARAAQGAGKERRAANSRRTAKNSTPTFTRPCTRCADPSVPAGSIVQVMQPGYIIGERVLRPALVAVAKGGPKAAPNSASGNDNKAAVQDS